MSYHYITDGNDVPVFDDLSFKIPDHSIFGIKGDSGAGKTTLLNLLAALEFPDRGEIIHRGKNLATMGHNELSWFRLNQIGIVFQDGNLLRHLTVEENISYPSMLRGDPKEEVQERTTGLMENYGLDSRASHFPHQLSGGEKKRVTIARALSNQPNLILIDEPFSGLDRANANIIMNDILQIHHNGTSIIVCSHNPITETILTSSIDLNHL